MHGEIDVPAVMERASRRRDWRERQYRNAEWVALKQWWRAERQVRRATTPAAQQQALQGRARTARLYAPELRRAWPKWQRAQEELRLRRQGKVLPDC